MSEISQDLQDQLRAGQEPLLRRFLEKKPGYDGPTLSAEDEQKIRDEQKEAAKARAEAILAHVRELGDDY